MPSLPSLPSLSYVFNSSCTVECAIYTVFILYRWRSVFGNGLSQSSAFPVWCPPRPLAAIWCLCSIHPLHFKLSMKLLRGPRRAPNGKCTWLGKTIAKHRPRAIEERSFATRLIFRFYSSAAVSQLLSSAAVVWRACLCLVSAVLTVPVIVTTTARQQRCAAQAHRRGLHLYLAGGPALHCKQLSNGNLEDDRRIDVLSSYLRRNYCVLCSPCSSSGACRAAQQVTGWWALREDLRFEMAPDQDSESLGSKRESGGAWRL